MTTHFPCDQRGLHSLLSHGIDIHSTLLCLIISLWRSPLSGIARVLQKAPQTEFSRNKAVGSAYVLFVATGVVFGCVYHLVF
jgi:hypothetical protein